MQAIKRVLAVRNGKIVLKLPDGFQSDLVEVIVLPYATKEKRTSNESIGDWREDFLSVSQWETDKEVARVSSWPIETF